jgi:hypothetical protein
VFQLCLNLNEINDSVGKALRTANHDRVTAKSHAFTLILVDPGFSKLLFVMPYIYMKNT